jgi:hypothetical protein
MCVFAVSVIGLLVEPIPARTAAQFYDVSIERLPARDKDDASCEVCGGMVGRNDTEVSAFRLIHRPEHPPSDEDNPE